MQSYTNSFTTPVLTGDQTLITGIALYFEGTTTTATLTFLDTAVIGLNIVISATAPTSTIVVKLGGTVINTTNIVPALQTGAWYYFELKVFCHPTAGTVEIRINGTSIISLTDINTQAGTNLCHNKVRLSSSNWCWYDDFYICDSSGTTTNDFQGVCKILPLLPKADTATVQWTPSTGLTHYNLVDENPYSTTDYVSSGTQAQIDLYNYQMLSIANTIIGIQISTICKLASGIGIIIEAPISSNSVIDLGVDTTLTSTTFGEIRRISETDPNTGAGWTAANLAEAQIGLKVM
jgi:hypothetical protein